MEGVCPRCLISKPDVSPVPEEILNRASALQLDLQIPPQVCSSCMDDLKSAITSNSVALDREVNREEKKAKLWRGRVTLLKRARAAMKKKAFGKALINYEKYLKSLEIVFDVDEDGLRPELFKERMSTKELTLITSAYWDLLRIYDTNEKYHQRMLKTATKLVQFAKVTPILMDIVKQADSYRKQAKNADVFKKILSDLMYQRNFCFIATSVFSEPQDWIYVDQLREFRDECLLKTKWGLNFIKIYYRFSPSVAVFLDRNEFLKSPIRFILKPISNGLSKFADD